VRLLIYYLGNLAKNEEYYVMYKTKREKAQKRHREDAALKKSIAYLTPVRNAAPQGMARHRNADITRPGIRDVKTNDKGVRKIIWFIKGDKVYSKSELSKPIAIDQCYNVTIKKEIKLRSGNNKGEMVEQDVMHTPIISGQRLLKEGNRTSNKKQGKRYQRRTEVNVTKGFVFPK
jgi:hypothetical protein